MVIDRLLGTRSYLAESEREVGVSVNLPRIIVLGPQAPVRAGPINRRWFCSTRNLASDWVSSLESNRLKTSLQFGDYTHLGRQVHLHMDKMHHTFNMKLAVGVFVVVLEGPSKEASFD